MEQLYGPPGSKHKINVIPFDPKTFDPKNPVAGIYSGMPIGYYHSPQMRHILSKSGLVDLRSCPAAAKKPDKKTAALALGRATDPYILEGHESFNREFVVMPDYPCPAGRSEKGWHNTKEYKEKVKAFADEHADSGKEIVDPDDFERIKNMDCSVKLNPWAQLILSQSNTQLTYIWQDTDIMFPDGTCIAGTGKWCKSRPDLTCLHSLDFSDLKTSKSVTHHGFQSAMLIYGYDVQAGMAFEGFFRLTGLVPKNFTMITVQSNPPFQCEVWPLIDERDIPEGSDAQMMSPWIIGGISEFHSLLQLYATCEAESYWPAYKPVFSKGKWLLRKANYTPLLTPGYYKPGEGLWENIPEE